jgi:hypothetical protein
MALASTMKVLPEGVIPLKPEDISTVIPRYHSMRDEGKQLALSIMRQEMSILPAVMEALTLDIAVSVTLRRLNSGWIDRV